MQAGFRSWFRASGEAAYPTFAGVIRFTAAETRWRNCCQATTRFEVTQFICTTRRGPAKGLWPCQEFSERRKISSVPKSGGSSSATASKSSPLRSSRRRPPSGAQAWPRVRVRLIAPAHAAHGEHGRAGRQVQTELLLHRLAEGRPVHGLDQTLQRAVDLDVVEGEGAGLVDGRIITADRLRRLGPHEALDHQIVIGVGLERRLPKGVEIEVTH